MCKLGGEKAARRLKDTSQRRELLKNQNILIPHELDNDFRLQYHSCRLSTGCTAPNALCERPKRDHPSCLQFGLRSPMFIHVGEFMP